MKLRCTPVADLWSCSDTDAWAVALKRYDEVIAGQGIGKLAALDHWYQHEFPAIIATRSPAHITHDELITLTEWKMARGVWRAPNLMLVKSNASSLVVETSSAALRLVPHPTTPVAQLATLAGVGPATASAVLGASHPALYPFFDELVAAQVPSLGKCAWTLGFYKRYAAALRDRAALIGESWTAAMVERALWSHGGGKAGNA